MSQPSRPHRGRDRNGENREHNREPRDRRDPHNGRPPSDRASTQPPYYPRRSSTPPPKHHRDPPREEPQESKCSYICSRSGIVLICAVLTNALVLICVVAAQMVMSGMSAMGGLAAGGFNINSAFTPFEGTELQQVRELDMQYSQMRAPGIYGGVAFSLTNGVVSLLFVVSGNRPAHRLSPKLLPAQFLFTLLGSVGYVVAVGLYLHFVISVNATDVCKRRERLYARNGQNWMNCDVGGADAAVALFGLITAILYAIACWLTGKAIRGVRRYNRERARHEARRNAEGSPHRGAQPQRAPLRSNDIAI
ncbi:MARVEL domain-containing protein 3 [Conger conger]|uniref:MARVEL domain-containing protein 3 n=1 Tax=Conger conger TaxID=82655 RepID=UPI002A59AEF4|nr:MARVEL domain-containing protein 3 [Conger conger]